MRNADECRHGSRCRSCLPGKLTVAEFTALHPDGATHAEIGAALGLTKQRVEQIEAQALAKLRKVYPHIRTFFGQFEHRHEYPYTEDGDE
jgi:hypothetical protein